MDPRPSKRSNRMLLSVVALSGILLAVSVAFVVYALDERAEDRSQTAQALASKNLSLAQARDQWSRYDYSVDACRRGNDLRQQVSDLSDGFVAVNQLLIEFFDSSARFRQESGQPSLALESIEARNTIKRVAENTHPVALRNCGNIAEPFVPRPKPLPSSVP